jgi:hypothetical protein
VSFLAAAMFPAVLIEDGKCESFDAESFDPIFRCFCPFDFTGSVYKILDKSQALGAGRPLFRHGLTIVSRLGECDFSQFRSPSIASISTPDNREKYWNYAQLRFK